jgi:acyl-coenzyme A thioesterase PaaI-like protein
MEERAYPPEEHMLRELAIVLDRFERAPCASLPVVAEICTDQRTARAGVLATLVDVLGGAFAARAAAPDRPVTSGLALYSLGAIRPDASVIARAHVLRNGRKSVVLEVEIAEREVPERLAALATMTLSRLQPRESTPRLNLEEVDFRTQFALPDSRLAIPFVERLGIRVLDPGSGVVEADVSPYLVNSLGAVQGGALATVLDVASEQAARWVTGTPVVIGDLVIHYLSLGKVGPLRTSARVLRRHGDDVVLRSEVCDAGASGRLLCVATAKAVRMSDG